MNNCDPILERLSRYLDGDLPESELALLRREADEIPECSALFEAMLWVHQTLDSAPFIAPAHDLSDSIMSELAWRHRRDKIILAGVFLGAVLIALAPAFLLVWAGLATMLEPGILQTAISWSLNLISDAAAYAVAAATLFSHAPQWFTVIISTTFSLSLLLLALAIATKKSPELIFGQADVHHTHA